MACKYKNRLYRTVDDDPVPAFIAELAKEYSCYFHDDDKVTCKQPPQSGSTYYCCLLKDHPGKWHMSTKHGIPIEWWL